jgi:hypothetical protein
VTADGSLIPPQAALRGGLLASVCFSDLSSGGVLVHVVVDIDSEVRYTPRRQKLQDGYSRNNATETDNRRHGCTISNGPRRQGD